MAIAKRELRVFIIDDFEIAIIYFDSIWEGPHLKKLVLILNVN